MKSILLSLFTLLVLINTVSASQIFISKTIGKRKVAVISVDLTDGKHKIVVSRNAQWSSTSLQELMNNVGGISAINWSYFCPDEPAYSRCGRTASTESETIAWGVSESKRWKDTGWRGIFWFDTHGTPLLVQNNLWYIKSYQNNTNKDRYNELMEGIGNFPIILDQWTIVDLNIYGSSIDSKLKSVMKKNFICHDGSNKVYMGQVDKISIYDLGKFLQDNFWCVDAINLDAWGSTAMIFDNKVINQGRKIPNAFVIVPTDGNYSPSPQLPTQTEMSYTLTNSPLDEAIEALYGLGLTKYNTTKEFKSNDKITREQASKFFAVLGEKIFEIEEQSSVNCNFKDLRKADKSLVSYITKACKFWIMKWTPKMSYLPRDFITYAQAVTVLARMMAWDQVVEKIWYMPYMNKAIELWIIDNISFKKAETFITRGNLALIIKKTLDMSQKLPQTTSSENEKRQPSFWYTRSAKEIMNSLKSMELWTKNVIED